MEADVGAGFKYPAINSPKKSGGEEFLNSHEEKRTLRDFWSWAYSDIVSNTERGKLAEFIVAMSLGTADEVRPSWDKYDLLSKDRIRVEVKASAYLQSWGQRTLSKITFGIQPTYGWDNESNAYDSDKKRQSDVYVFCVLKHKQQATLNPLDLSQWEFYVLSTPALNRGVPEQKTISLTSLLQIGAKQCDYSKLHATIRSEGLNVT